MCDVPGVWFFCLVMYCQYYPEGFAVTVDSSRVDLYDSFLAEDPGLVTKPHVNIVRLGGESIGVVFV
jgi:hypothetical protein